MAEAMKGVTKAMGRMNRQMNLPGLQKIMMEFEKQVPLAEIKGSKVWVCLLNKAV